LQGRGGHRRGSSRNETKVRLERAGQIEVKKMSAGLCFLQTLLS